MSLSPPNRPTDLAASIRSTWSVVVVNIATGEIGVAQATCIVGPDLRNSLAVVVPGVRGRSWWARTRRAPEAG